MLARELVEGFMRDRRRAEKNEKEKETYPFLLDLQARRDVHEHVRSVGTVGRCGVRLWGDC